jgi:uncharacterized RDD family membrane protein YckC
MEENNQKQFKVTEDLFVKADKRFFNFIIDTVMLSIILFIGLVIYIANTYTTPNETKEFMDRFLANSMLQYTVTSVITLVYYNFFEICTSRTVGKFCTNTIVVDENGDRASYEAIMIRSLIRIIPLYWISFIVFPTRGLHDLVSKTYVVNKKKLEQSKSAFIL